MNPDATEKLLRQFLKGSAKPLKSLTAPDLLHLACEFWLSTTPDNLRQENGDGIVVYFELTNRGKGTLYEFGVNRIMCPSVDTEQYSAWVLAYKLRFLLGFKPTLEVFQLKPPVVTFTCWEKANSSALVEAVRNSPQFQLVTPYTQHSSGIALSECAAPWGNPEHPTQGLSWAIA